MSDHELKLDTAYFFAAEVGDKPFEVRFNDRDYKIGDTLLLREYLPESETYTGKSIRRKITYVLTDERYVLPGYAILGLSIHSPAEERYREALEEIVKTIKLQTSGVIPTRVIWLAEEALSPSEQKEDGADA